MKDILLRRNRRSLRKVLLNLLASFIIISLFASNISATTVIFSNTTAINTNLAPDAGPASPYPSTINVTGLSGTITKVTVTLTGITHTFPDDVDVLLVGPGGQNLILMSDAGTGDDITGVNLTFDDAASAQLPDSAILTTGTYRPTNHGGTVVDTFIAPAPAGPHGNPGPSNSGTATLASVFNTTNPNGAWSLYIVDDAGGDEGFIAGGWSLNITTTGSPATNFSNTERIRLSDLRAASTPYPSNITVSGLTGTITNIKVTLHNITHPNPDDFDILLVGPGGQKMIIMSDAGGTPDITGVTLTLDDAAPNPLPDSTVLTTGSYRPADYTTLDTFPSPAPEGPYQSAAPVGTATLNGVFGGTNPNGVWSLYVVDDISGTTSQGTIGGGWSLDITTGTTTTNDAVLDYDGDGKTDYVVVRNTGSGSTGQVRWFVQGAINSFERDWGLASDSFVAGDFDGDGKDDITVYRPTTPPNSFFLIFQSSNNTFVARELGATGDDPSVVGDYDGDGKDDVAVYRAGATPGSQSFWYYRPSTTPSGIVYIQWGAHGHFPAPGDYDGDGKHDFCTQSDTGSGNARFNLWKSSGGIEYVLWGHPSDLVAPGDYDGDGKTDFAALRNVGGRIHWNVLGRNNNNVIFFDFAWGLAATDFPTQGDYDGDGKTDLAVWRPNADPSMNFFYVRQSSNGALSGAELGQQGDYPVANYNTR